MSMVIHWGFFPQFHQDTVAGNAGDFATTLRERIKWTADIPKQ